MSITEIIPQRAWIYLLLFFGGVGAVFGIEYSFWILPWITQKLGGVSISALELNHPHSFAVWFLSASWLCGGMICFTAFRAGRVNSTLFQKCALKREQLSEPPLLGKKNAGKVLRSGDIWIWAVFCCFLLSVDSTCRLREVIRVLSVEMSGTELYAEGHVWWVSAYFLLFGMVGSRLLVEMRHALLSCNTFFMGVLLHLISFAVVLKLLSIPGDPRFSVMVQTGCEMLGTVFILLSFGLFTRKLLIQNTLLNAAWESLRNSGKDSSTEPAAQEKMESASSLKNSSPSGRFSSPGSQPAAKSGVFQGLSAKDPPKEKKTSISESVPLEESESSTKKENAARSRSCSIVHPAHQEAKKIQWNDEEEESDDSPQKNRTRRMKKRPRFDYEDDDEEEESIDFIEEKDEEDEEEYWDQEEWEDRKSRNRSSSRTVKKPSKKRRKRPQFYDEEENEDVNSEYEGE